MKRKMLSLMMAGAIFLTAICGCSSTAGKGVPESETEETAEKEQSVSEGELVRHEIPAGESKGGNPLKGLIPFQGAETDFPYSMEWFYLPVSSVQIAMNIFDWMALEEKLDAAAQRGHQAVFRLYYDYPGLETGVPQFLIDGGLEMKEYDEDRKSVV